MRGLLMAALMLWSGAAWAGDTVATAHVTARLVADVASLRPGQSANIGLRLTMAPGWHTYWKNPGDAGAPPTLAWTLPQGARAGGLRFPAPRVLTEGELTTYGHTDTILLASSLVGGGDIGLRADWLVCKDICVPEGGDLTLGVPPGDGAPSAEAPLFAAARQAEPQPLPGRAAVADDGTLLLSDPAWTRSSVRAAVFVPDDDTVVPRGTPAVGDGTLTVPLLRKGRGPVAGVLLLTDGGGQLTAWTIDAGPGVATLPARHPIGTALLLALLGGAVLNLMPCVFPVLALKAAGLAALGADRRHARRSAWAYTAGTVATFTLLGGALIAARAAGHAALGWGFHLQSTPFVLAMALLLFAAGLNLSGVFAVGAGRLAGAGQGAVSRGGWIGDAATGALAVLVATPCTAPFMAAALATALVVPAWQAVAIFAALGLGLAAPYALVASVPAFARALPRPGRWMETLRQALAFPVYAAAGWLAWVAVVQAGSDAALAAIGGAVALGLAGWLLGRAQAATWRVTRRAAGALSLLSAGVAASVLLLPLSPAAPAQAAGTEPFSTAAIEAAGARGQTVFVDMSAAWCITCLVNERVALRDDAVLAAFAAGGVRVLRGDWTRRDGAIGAYLAAQGRDGVPLYQLIRPGAAPVTLPQILTPGIVLAALRG